MGAEKAMKSTYKAKNSFEERTSQYTKVIEMYPNRIPVIVERAANCTNIPDIDKTKYLIPGDFTVTQLLFLIRKRIKLNETQALFVYIDGTLPASTAVFSALYEQHKDKDGFLYVIYSGESSFGSL